MSLFTRNTHEVALTEVGAEWLPQVQEALQRVDGSLDFLSARSARDRKIRLGYLIGTGADLLFRLIRQFEASHPEISIEPKEFDFSDPTAGLADGATEVAIIRPPVDLPQHRMFALDTETWVACLPRDHPLAARAEVAITELLDDPLIVAPSSAGSWRDYWMAVDVRNGRAPTIAGVAATYEAETTLVARGLGISFTSSSVARLYQRPGIVYVPITERPAIRTTLAWNPSSLSFEADALVRHVCANWDHADKPKL